MIYIMQKKEEYKIPLAELCNTLPDLLCDSMLDGGLEDLTEEEWSL